MNRASVQAIRLIKDSFTGQYIWQPAFSQSVSQTLLGLPVYQAAEMDVPKEGSLSIALADFKAAYLIVDRLSIRVMRDPYTEKPFVKFYCSKRVGGDVVNFEAIKLLLV